MANASSRQITFWASPYTDTPIILAVASDDVFTGNGKEAIVRSFRDANGSDPGRIRRAEWEVWGPIGNSLESSSGVLGIDWCRDLESRWERRLISAGAETTRTLTGDDPPATEDAIFGETIFGDVDAPFGSPISGGDVVVFDEQRGYVFASRERLVTQTDPANSFAVIETQVMDANVRDADHWRGTSKLALGPSAIMQRRYSVNSGGSQYEDVTATSPSEDVYASAIKRGSDRAWYINANESQSSYNYAGYTLDDFITLASPFQVGDPDVGTTGIGPFGPFTYFGADDNIYSFTDQGKPIPLSRALTSVHSDLNGRNWADPGWGWNYYISATGLRAVNLGGIDNPVGIGERMRGFTGHAGIATAVYQIRGELYVVYQTTAGDLYGYRCTFGPQTAGTGQPLMFPWFYVASQTCRAIFSTTTSAPSQGITVIRGAGTNMTTMTIAGNGRDDLYGSYVYSTGGGIAWLTTLDRNPNLLKTLRLARFRARGMGASGNSWTLAFAFDSSPTDPVNATYVNMDAVTADGFYSLIPDNGTVTGQGNPSPTASIAGRTIKPRFTQVAGGASASTTPPEVNGTLEVEYDERPEQIEEVEVVLHANSTGWTTNKVWDTLRTLVGQQTSQPLRIQIPDDVPAGVSAASGGGQKYGMIASVSRRLDIKADDVEAISVVIQVWPQASALGV